MTKPLIAAALVAVIIVAGVSLFNKPREKWKPLGPVKPIQWHNSLDKAIVEAERDKKPILVDFYATWCAPCKLMDKETYPDPQVMYEAERWVMVKIDVDKNQQIALKYNATELPTTAFLKSDGTHATGFVGFASPGDMANMMQQAYPKTQ